MEFRIAAALAAALNPENDRAGDELDQVVLDLGESGNVEVQSYAQAGVASRDPGFVLTVGSTQYHVTVTHARGPVIDEPAPERDPGYGILHDYRTGEELRPATREERARSDDAGETGAFELDGRACYVQP